MDKLTQIINEEIEEGWGKNLAAGAMMTAATLGGMNASAQNTQQDRQQPETSIQTPEYSTNPRIARMQKIQSDRLFFRVYGTGTSMDENMAEKKALSNAKEKLAQQMGMRGHEIEMKGMRYEIDDDMMVKDVDGQYTVHIMVSMEKPKR
jgi:hypothetical protein